jgi:hypothetical protein
MSPSSSPGKKKVSRHRAAVQSMLPLTTTQSEACVPNQVRQQCLELLAELLNAGLRAEGNPVDVPNNEL